MMKGLMYKHLLVGVMRAGEAWGNRWKSCANPLSLRFMEVATKKQSLVILAADLKTTKALAVVACILKTAQMKFL